MKRSAGLQRRKPLAGSIETYWAWQRRSRGHQQAKPRTQSSRVCESRARRLVQKRSGGLCEIRLDGLCTRWATEWHHRIRRAQGGQWTASNGLAACSRCHLAVTNTNGQRAKYRRLGLVLDRSDNPAVEPVVCIHGRVRLDDAGGWRLDGAAEGAA